MEIAAILFILGIFLLLFGIAYRIKLLENVDYECSFSTDEAFVGDEIEFTEIITNRKFLPVPWAKSELTVSAPLEFSELSSVATGKIRWVTSFFALRSYSRVKRTWRVKCSKRGVFGVDSIIVLASAPLGISKKYFILRKEELALSQVTVLPVREEDDVFISELGSVSGDIFTEARLISDPFFVNGVREYRITDHIRDINWFATAKNQELMVNNHDYTTDRDISVVLNVQSLKTDITDAVRPEYVEKCIRICAGVIHDSCINGRRVRLLSNDITTGEFLDIQSGNEFDLLYALARIEIKIGEDIKKFLYGTVSEMTDNDVIVVTAFSTEEFENIKTEYPNISFLYPEIMAEVAE